MRAYERLLRYVQFDTASDEKNACCPSTEGQRVFGQALVEELRALGAQDARMDEHGYVYASVPANAEGQPAIGLIAHMDTVDGVPCQPMRPRIARYDGGTLVLDEETGEALRPEQFPGLADYVGQDLIVTDGRTLLGADDKAGIAEIMTLLEALRDDPSVRHGKLCVAFTPDEEIGEGADLFDVDGFGADFAYTVDGGRLGEIEFENFNAASAKVTVHGVDIHPGSAKDKMRNAILLAMQYHALLPQHESPSHTEGYEGFYHLGDFTGCVETTQMRYILRDHDREKFEARKARMLACGRFLNEQYGQGVVEVEIQDSYYNMKEKLLPHMHIVERAEAAMRSLGVTPLRLPIRGGTDGARLSFMGLPCPNLCTGGANAHGRHEFASVQAMDVIVEILREIVRAR